MLKDVMLLIVSSIAFYKHVQCLHALASCMLVCHHLQDLSHVGQLMDVLIQRTARSHADFAWYSRLYLLCSATMQG